MFWGYFSYDFKGPCHIWKSESKKESEESKEILGLWNKAIEPTLFAQWDLKTKERRARSHYKGGRKPQWKFSVETGKFI
jgi:hypothetical protein